MILPVHPKPFSDELLSSWMVRTALANNYNLHTFYHKILRIEQPIWTRDIDRCAPPSLLQSLAEKTTHSPSLLESLTLRRYTGLLFDHLNVGGSTEWVRRLGIQHRKRTRLGMPFCPLCLGEDKNAYFRCRWRIALYTVCEKHRCYLNETCSNCGASIAFHRNGIGTKKDIPKFNLGHCHQCKALLSDSAVAYPIDVNDTVFNTYVNLLNKPKIIPYKNIRENVELISSFYSGLLHICRILTHRRANELFQFGLERTLNSSLPLMKSHVRQEFEDMSVEQQFEIMMVALWLISCWPKNYIKACRRTKTYSSVFSDIVGRLPFWLASVVRAPDFRRYLDKATPI